MKRRVVWSLLAFVILIGASLTDPQTASSNSANQSAVFGRAFHRLANFNPMLATTFDIDRTDDTAAATACTGAANDCSLRGAIIASNADVSGMPVTISLQPATTYNLTLANATQENAAATGDLDITTTNHSVTILGGGSSGPNASIIDASGLTSGNMRDRAFQITSPGVTVIFQDLVIQNGKAADNGSNGASTNPTAQNNNRFGGGILSNGGNVTLDNVLLQSCQALGKGDTVVNDHTTLDANGGGLASLTGNGNVIITDSTLTGNQALGGDGGDFNNGAGSNARGGSIYFEGGTLNISGSRILQSSAIGGLGGDGPGNQQNGGQGGITQGGGAWIGSGIVTINNATFENCSAVGGNSGTGQNGTNPGADASGGGLYSLGNVTITNSTFDLNSANGGDAGDAFGLDCFGGHNAGDGGAARGGAILADGGSMVINTATFASNSANGGDGGDGGQTNGGLNCGMHGAGGLAHGGAITNTNAATLNIKHATISLNNAQAGNTGVNQGGANKPARLVAEGSGGGIRVGPGGVTLENTIIAGNTAANGLGDTTGAPTPGSNVDGVVTSNGHNLLDNPAEATGFTGAGDQTGANPMLAALANNGGPTQTMMPAPTSPAIDAGVAAGATFDQRGKPRTFDDAGVANAATSDGTDIGAVEAQPECSLTCPSDITVPNDPGVCGAIVNYTEPSGAGCGTVTCDHPSGSFFPVGETMVTCTSSVGPTCSFKVKINDTELPVITSKGPIEIWAPNHQYDSFNINDLVASVSDNCDSTIGVNSVVIASVSSDEPVNSNGDGNTTNDIVIGDECKSVQLRSERMGDGNGRVYTINLQVADAAGNVGTATGKVTVPHSQNGSAAIDDGPQYAVSGCTANPLETADYFVRQQYKDFLGREPDPGLNFWVNNIESCGADWGCRQGKRIDTSAAFFLSTEFRHTGFLVYRTYQAAYGELPNAPVPIRWSEFKTDTQQISNGVVVLREGWERVLELNTQAFMVDFVQRGRFTTAYPLSLSPAQFVDRMFGNAGLPLTEADRAAAIAEFGTANDTSDLAARARALRRVAENAKLEQAAFNRAFVLMQYYGYLRRDPNSSPDADYTGYQFWLDKLNRFEGNFREAEMVKAFLASGEYRGRFLR